MTERSRATMTKTTMVVVILLLVSISSVYFADSLLQDGVGKFLGSFAAFKLKIPELLNQLCNDSQGSNATRRDACYGCFFRASILPQGYAMLIAMSTCANSYLNNTSYGHCQSYLKNATSAPNTRARPTIIYCTFLECVRQVNKNNLGIDVRSGRRVPLRVARLDQAGPFIFWKVAKWKNAQICRLNLRQCVREARGTPSANYTDTQLAQLFVNTTVCVLARTRCSYPNPVTGELQDDDIVNKLHLPSINAILVNTDYDINIVQLPFRHSSADVCAKYRNVQQATWPNVVC